MSKFINTIQKVTESIGGAYKESDFESTTDVDRFVAAQAAAMSKRTTDRNQVDILTPEGAQSILDGGGYLFIATDDSAGSFVKGDGYMGGLFKDPTSGKSGASKVLQKIRRDHGGKFFDAYATHLEDIYIKNGYKPVARLDFVSDYAPSGWDDEGSSLASKPDVAFFVYDPSSGAVKGDGVRMDDWDKAYDLAKSMSN